jgi:hypothetical protein
MGQYTDLFMRCNLNDNGSIPRSGTLCTSPDIIPYGVVPVSDPVTSFTANYSEDVGQALIANQQNFIYTRAINHADGAANGNIYLYYSPAALLLYPSLWSNNGLKTSQGVDHVPVSATNANQIAVATDPFTWIPQQIVNDHYCMVARLATQSNPCPIPSDGDINDFANWISNNGGWTWRNVTVVDAGAPTWTQTLNYTQGATAGTMNFLIKCTNVPVGGKVALSCGTPGPSPLISIPPTPVTNGASFIIGLASNIPANFVSNIAYSYWANGNPQPGFKIELQVVYIVPSTQKALSKIARPLAVFGSHEGNTQGMAQALGKSGKVSIGPTPAIMVGSHTTKTIT